MTTGDDENISVATIQPLGGRKTISYFAGIALLINNITGPGVPAIPNLFAEAGWLIPTLLFVGVCVMSSLSTTMYCEAMRRIAGNDGFRGRIEYTTIIRHYFGDRMYYAALVGLNGALQSLNIISVIQSAQVMDNAISAIFGRSCGLNASPFANRVEGSALPASTSAWSCVDTNDIDAGNPWGCHVVLSAGFVVAIFITLPMGYFNLDDNMVIQVGAFVLTIMCWLAWFIACFFSDSFSNGTYTIPAVTDSSRPWSSQAAAVGTILFNYGFVTTVPSWVNEKQPHVSVNKTVWISTWSCNLIFFLLGIPGAMAFQSILEGPATGQCAGPFGNGTSDCADSLMSVFTSDTWIPASLREHSAAHFVMRLSVYMFPVVATMSSIPIFSIVIKYNCLENGWPRWAANLWGILFPWVVSVPIMYMPDAFNQFITYSSLVFVSFTDFMVPWCLYITLMRSDSEYKLLSRDTDCDAQLPSPVVVESVVESIANEASTDLFAAAPVHHAVPPRWGLTAGARARGAALLTACMIALAVYGTVSSVQQSATNAWTCAMVAEQS